MKTIFKLAATSLTSILLASQMAWAAPVSYDVDPVHSSIVFSIRHFVSQVEGRFKAFTGTISYDIENPSNSTVKFSVTADSISTDNEKRDGHLKSADFFDVAKYPTLAFESKKVVPRGKDSLDVVGVMTIHGVSKNMTIPVTVLGVGKGKQGPVAGFKSEFPLNRKDFGIVWNSTLDNGGTMLGDDVNIRINVEAHGK